MCLSRLGFLVLAHYIRVFYILLKELSNPGKLFSKKSTVLTTPRFFGFIIYLNSLFRFWSPHSDMISANFLTAFWIAFLLLEELELNRSFPNFSWVLFWFGEEWNKKVAWLSHLYVFEWLSTFPFPNLTKELLKVAVIGACLESKLERKTLSFITFFIRDLLKTR